jgi:hypothetical protein
MKQVESLIFNSEDGSEMFLRNDCWILVDYTALFLRRYINFLESMEYLDHITKLFKRILYRGVRDNEYKRDTTHCLIPRVWKYLVTLPAV